MYLIFFFLSLLLSRSLFLLFSLVVYSVFHSFFKHMESNAVCYLCPVLNFQINIRLQAAPKNRWIVFFFFLWEGVDFNLIFKAFENYSPKHSFLCRKTISSIGSSSSGIVVDRYVMSFLFKCRISMGLKFQNKFISLLSSERRRVDNNNTDKSSSKNYTEIKYRWETVPAWSMTEVSCKLWVTRADEMTTQKRKHINVLEMFVWVSGNAHENNCR